MALIRRVVFAGLLALVLAPSSLSGAPVTITLKPRVLVHTTLMVPVSTDASVERVELLVNGVKSSEQRGRSMVFPLSIGKYIRRLRIRAVGYDAANQIVGDDEMVVNDPRPPFRVRLFAPRELPASGTVELTANVISPEAQGPARVDFYVGEQKIGSDDAAPYLTSFDASSFQGTSYVRAAASTADGAESNDVRFFGTTVSDQIDVSLQQLPISVSGSLPLDTRDVEVNDNGVQTKIEGIVPATDQSLSVVLLIDTSESMYKELPVVRAAARGFVASLLRPVDRLALVEFYDRAFWLTDFTSDQNLVNSALEKLRTRGTTHLYDSIIEMLFELQKRPGRHALVVLTDGVDQGSTFALDHVIHYAKYAGVPIYPIVKNTMLSRLMKFGIGRLEARRLTNIARDTGATHFIIEREDQLPAVYAKIAAELKEQYLLMFYSQPSAQDQWHSVAVRSRSGRPIRAPRGYFP
ncbi:MAG TPA: VWA domain-containing protein [Thermoanaerobaculia bacterium]|nr:VWA domain-containing protein [Thermoanaerobaculia bacterium]